MRSHPLIRPIRAALVLGLVVSATAAPSSASSNVWYVSASAAPGGDGTQAAPLDSLATAEDRSAPGDTIIVLPASVPLDGGIRLKPGQRLIGDGPPVVGSSASDLPRVTNSTPARHDGDAVVLADGSEVANLVIAGSHRGAIYGLDATEVSA